MEDDNNNGNSNFHIARRNTQYKLQDMLQKSKEKFEQKQSEEKNKKPSGKINKEEIQKEIRKSIIKQDLGYNKDIFQKLEKFIFDYNEKHKITNFEQIPDYLSKKEDDSSLIKSCNQKLNNYSLEFPIILIEDDFYNNIINFLESYIKYEKYKDIINLKAKLIIRKSSIKNYNIFHEDKIKKENNYFISETISSSMVELYNEGQLKDIKQSLMITSNYFKNNFEIEIKKWVATVYNIMTDYIIFKLKDKPLYYCCDKCKKPILYKEKSLENILIENKIYNQINNNKINDNNLDKNNNTNYCNKINEEEYKNKIEKIKNQIELKKENDKKLINKIISNESKKIEYKNLFNVANNLINLIDFSKFESNEEGKSIANPPKKNEENDSKTINNLLYYTNNKYADYELFEKNTSGSFILTTDLETFDHTLNCLENDNDGINHLGKFILLLSGNNIKEILDHLVQKNYLNSIGRCIIYSKDDKYKDLTIKYNKIEGVFKTKKGIIKYINNYNNPEGKYFTFKLINLTKYSDYYYKFHQKLSSFYGQLSENLYDIKINILKGFLKESESGVNHSILLKAMKNFSYGDNNKIEIIKGYTSNDYYEYFNKWLYSYDSLALEQTGYFLAGLIYSLNLYGEEAKTAINNEITLYRGVSYHYINILPYKNNIGNIITFPNFTSSSTLKSVAENFSIMNQNGKNDFRVIFEIKHKFKKNWTPNAVDVEPISECKGEEEKLFQPYSFFKINSVNINIKEKTADIKMETIGKTSILEEGLKNGKKIWYNYKENAMEISN